jgi:hypothetical protein
MAGSAETLHIIFKNKHADFPVRNALEMQSLLFRISCFGTTDC